MARCALATALSVGAGQALGRFVDVPATSAIGLVLVVLGFAALAWVVLARLRWPRLAGHATEMVGVSLVAVGLGVVRGACSGGAVRHEVGWRDERAGWLEGGVVEGPESARGGVRFLLRVEASSLRLPRGLVASLWSDSAAGIPRFGATIRTRASLHAPRVSNTPGGFDEVRWLESRGASLSGSVLGAAWSEPRGPPATPRVFLDRLRARWSARLSARVPGESGEFLRGLLLGERDRVSPEAVDELRRAGVLHLLALSGQHVALVAVLLVACLRWVRVGARAEAVASGLGVWAYAVLSGSSPSVVRAAVAASVSGLGRFLGRRVSGGDALAWSTALAIFAAPRLALDAGFQLSCLASVGLLVSAAIERRLAWRSALAEPRWAASGTVRWLLRLGARSARGGLSLLLATTCAQLAVLPLLAARFSAVSLVGLASNLFLVPLCAALLAFGLPLLVLDSVIPTPASAWRPLSALAAVLLEGGGGFASWPGAWRACTLEPGWALACLALAIGAAAVGSGAKARNEANVTEALPRSAGRSHGAAWAAAGLALGIAVTSFAALRPAPQSTLRYWLLDVGQGDAQVLEFADGRVLIVDCGDARQGFDAGARVLVPFLRARHIAHVDCVVVTHEDRDHSGGWPALAREASIGELDSGSEALQALRDRGTRGSRPIRSRAVAAGDTLLQGVGYRVRVLWPPAGHTGLASNERCVVLEVEADGQRLFLTGDADSLTEEKWLPAVSGPADFLKLGHHGSRSSTGLAVLAALRPARAGISCGRHNRFGHPHAETLARLGRARVPVSRTDRDGTLRIDFGDRIPDAPLAAETFSEALLGRARPAPRSLTARP